MRYFYSYLIEIESLIGALDELNLEDHHKHNLAALIDSSLHYTILDAILSELSEEDKKSFLERLSKEPESLGLMDFLNSRVDKIEDKIKSSAKQLKEQLHKEIKEARLR